MDDEDDDDAAGGPAPHDSPTHHNGVFGPLPRVRFYRDGVTHAAPPDDAGFHDVRSAVPSSQSVVVIGGRGGRKNSAELAAEAARAGEGRLGSSWMADLQGGGGGNKGGGGEPQHRRTMVEWIDRNQCAMRDSERTARAALYLHDAIDTRAPRHFSRGHLTVKAYSFFKSPAWSGLVLSAVVLHLLLALWEPPRRLPDSAPYHDSLNRHTLRSGHETAQHLLGLEAFLVMLYICDLLLEIFALGPAAFFSLGPPPRVVAGMGRSAAWASKTWSQVRFVLVLLFLLDVSGNINGGITTHFSRALRPLMLICVCDPLKRWSVLLVKILSQLRDVAISIAIVLALFALTGLVLFRYHSLPSSLPPSAVP